MYFIKKSLIIIFGILIIPRLIYLLVYRLYPNFIHHQKIYLDDATSSKNEIYKLQY